MDNLSLRFFNTNMDLGLTASDLKEIDEEVNKKYKTGLYVIKEIKKGKIVINHDEKHNIELRKSESIEAKQGESILFQSIISLKDLPKELFCMHSLVKFRSYDKLVRLKTKDLNDLKPKMIERLCNRERFEIGEGISLNYVYDKYELEKLTKKKDKLIQEQLKAISWLFDCEAIDLNIKTRPNIHTIIKTIQLENKRVCIIKVKEDRVEENHSFFHTITRELKNSDFYMIVVNPDDPRYNYCSPGREMILSYPEVWVSDELIGKLTYGELEEYSKQVEGRAEFKLLTPKDYTELSANIKMKMAVKKREDSIRDATEKATNELEKKYNSGKEVIKNGVVYGSNYIIYGTKKIEYKGIKDIILDRGFLNSDYISTIGDIFETIVDKVLLGKLYDREEKLEVIKVNDFELSISLAHHKVLINNKRINKDDLRNILLQAINMNKEQYEEYLNECSKLSLHLQEVLNEGYIKTTIDFKETKDNELFSSNSYKDIEIAIPIKFDKSLYLNINGWKKVTARKYIADLEKSIEIYSAKLGTYEGRLQRFVRILFKAVKGLDPDDLNDFLKKAKRDAVKLKRKLNKERKAKIDNSLIFIKKCVEATKAERVKKGYLIKGDSGCTYFVDDDMRVSLVKEDKLYSLCIVDDNNYRRQEWEINDGVGQRLLMLSKDKQLAKEIYTNGDRIDKHWLKIMEE